jgi:hypothetical protein
MLPLHFRDMTSKNGIEACIYTPPEDIFDLPERQPDNKCYCGENDETYPAKGLQNVAPCQFGKCHLIVLNCLDFCLIYLSELTINNL